MPDDRGQARQGYSSRRSNVGWAVLVVGLCLLLAVPVYVVWPTAVAAAAGRQPAWLIDPVVRAFTVWRVDLPLLASGIAVSALGLWLQRHNDRRAGVAASRALGAVALVLAAFGLFLVMGLVVGVVFVLLLV